MRIWHLTKSLSGGAGQYALRLSNALRADGVESTVLLAEGPLPEGTAGLKRVNSPVRRFAARCFRSLSHRISLGAFHSLHGPEHYEAPHLIQKGDIVHLHGMTGWIGVSGLRKLIPRGTKVFWTAHDLWMLSGGCVVYQGCDQFRKDCSKCPILRTPWKRLAKRELKVKKDFIEAYRIRPSSNSQWTADRVRESKLFGSVNSIPVILPAVHPAYLAEAIPGLRRELKIQSDRKVISLGARSLDDKFKGIPDFLEQLAKEAEFASQLTVLLFGPGTIKIPVNLDVRLLGNITDPCKLAKVYRTSDVYVSPSSMETFGMTLVEAQACGTPVLCFSVGGTPEALRDGKTGWLIPCGDYPALVTQLRSLLGAPEQPAKAGHAARQWVADTFRSGVIARQLKTIYATADK
jgi:glycosyltransferase involved in cell wall biosynthesis